MAMETLASSGLQTLLLGVALVASADAIAEAEIDEVPDMDFLEYLGLWEETDEDWLLLEEQEVADNDERSDTVPEGEESTETEDEG
jgi:hypothetical protein